LAHKILRGVKLDAAVDPGSDQIGLRQARERSTAWNQVDRVLVT
jgi:hypothetical protein